MVFLLAGNPNCGKTTLFNTLTGLDERVSNYPGVTVSLKSGRYKKDKSVSFTDIPGIYTLSSISGDEVVATKALFNLNADGVIVVVDGTKLERSLYLVAEVLRLGKPVTVAINFYDDLLKNGIKIDYRALSTALGVPVVNISAKTGHNVDLLIKTALNNNKKPNLVIDKNIPDFIKRVANGCLNYKKTRAEVLSTKLDKILLSKFGYVIFILSILTMFFVADRVGGFFANYLNRFFDYSINSIRQIINTRLNVYIFADFITDGVIRGTFSVISFLPNVVIIFFFLSLFEYTGYASRIAFLTDNVLSKVGLSGKSTLPFFIGMGCSVTGVLSTKIIETSTKRNRTILLVPFMPCSAKLVVINFFATFLTPYPYVVTVSIYLLSILIICIFGYVFKKTGVYGVEDFGFLMELPTYRVPNLKEIGKVLIKKSKTFLFKAGSVIATTNVIIWLLSSFDFTLNYVGSLDGGMLMTLGKILSVLFKPLGFTGWQPSVALITGLFAREGVVSTLSNVNLTNCFLNDFSVYGFLTFVSFYPPCLSAIFTVKQELGKNHKFVFVVVFWLFFAYLIVLLINLTGILYYINKILFFAEIALFFLFFIGFCIKMFYGKKIKNAIN